MRIRAVSLAVGLALLLVATVTFSLAVAAPRQQQEDPPSSFPELSLVMTKTVGLLPELCADESAIELASPTTVYVCFTIENSSDAFLGSHDLADDSSLGLVLDGLERTLGPGEQMQLIEPLWVAESREDVAYWVARTTDGLTTGAASAIASIQLLPPGALRVEATVGSDPEPCGESRSLVVSPGSRVAYCYRMFNDGPQTVTVESLVDPAAGSLSPYLPLVIPPGHHYTLRHERIVEQPLVGAVRWEARTTRGTFGGQAPHTLVSFNETLGGASLTLTKTVGLDPTGCAPTTTVSVLAGQSVTYCYRITNTGTVTYTSHDLLDSHLGQLVDGLPYTLTPGASFVVTATAVIEQETTNLAIWSAQQEGSGGTDFSSAEATVLIAPDPEPALVLSKTVSADPTTCGTEKFIVVRVATEVTYCYTVTNTGNVTLTEHTLEDSTPFRVLNHALFPLAPGESTFVTHTTLITKTRLTVAFWTGQIAGTAFQARDGSLTLVGVRPYRIGIDLTKTVTRDLGNCGFSKTVTSTKPIFVTYCYGVINTGSVTLTLHDLRDNELGQILEAAPLLLGPRDVFIVTRTVLVESTTSNVATWRASITSQGPRTIDSDTASVIIGDVTATTLGGLGARAGGATWWSLLLLLPVPLLLLRRRRRGVDPPE